MKKPPDPGAFLQLTIPSQDFHGWLIDNPAAIEPAQDDRETCDCQIDDQAFFPCQGKIHLKYKPTQKERSHKRE